jgi:hypothetical protein
MEARSRRVNNRSLHCARTSAALIASLGIMLCSCQSGGQGSTPPSVYGVSERDDVQYFQSDEARSEEKSEPKPSGEVTASRQGEPAGGTNAWSRLFGRMGEPTRRIPLPRTDAENIQTVSGSSPPNTTPIDEF